MCLDWPRLCLPASLNLPQLNDRKLTTYKLYIQRALACLNQMSTNKCTILIRHCHTHRLLPSTQKIRNYGAIAMTMTMSWCATHLLLIQNFLYTQSTSPPKWETPCKTPLFALVNRSLKFWLSFSNGCSPQWGTADWN